MTPRNKMFDDLSQLMTNAMGVAQGARDEAENAMKSWMDRWLADRDFVTREEFDALRTRHEAVAARLAALEAKMPTTADSPTTAPARRKTAKAATSRTKKAAK